MCLHYMNIAKRNSHLSKGMEGWISSKEHLLIFRHSHSSWQPYIILVLGNATPLLASTSTAYMWCTDIHADKIFKCYFQTKYNSANYWGSEFIRSVDFLRQNLSHLLNISKTVKGCFHIQSLIVLKQIILCYMCYINSMN